RLPRLRAVVSSASTGCREASVPARVPGIGRALGRRPPRPTGDRYLAYQDVSGAPLLKPRAWTKNLWVRTGDDVARLPLDPRTEKNDRRGGAKGGSLPSP